MATNKGGKLPQARKPVSNVDLLVNALRELVRAEQARTQALLDMQAQLPNLSPAAFDAMRGYAHLLSASKDWRDISAVHLATMLRVIEQA